MALIQDISIQIIMSITAI